MLENQSILAPIGAGELVDKITILRIKEARVKDLMKLENVRHELNMLEKIKDLKLCLSPEMSRLENELMKVNEELWETEDAIRNCEAVKNYGQDFIQLARLVYIKNDFRAQLKKQINLLAGSKIIEEKFYETYS